MKRRLMSNKRYELIQANICWFGKKDGGYYINFFSQEPIYCVVDYKTGLAIDLSTYLSYPYYEYDVSKFCDYIDKGYLNENTLLVTFRCENMAVSREIMSKFRYICKLIDKGEEFPMAKNVMSAEEYRKSKLSPETIFKLSELQKKYGKKF